MQCASAEVDVGHLFHSKLLGVVGAKPNERERWVVINGMANIEQNRAASTFLRQLLFYTFLLLLLLFLPIMTITRAVTSSSLH